MPFDAVLSVLGIAAVVLAVMHWGFSDLGLGEDDEQKDDD